MNTSILKNGLLALSLSTALVSPVFATNFTPITEKHIALTNEIKITIDKNTKDSEFKAVTKTLKEHNIEAKFSGIKRNKNNEIIAIKIQLEDNKGNESNTSISSSNPIDVITLGAENDSLYITSSSENNFSFNGRHSLSKHFDFSFDDEDEVMFINGKKFDFKDIKNKVKNAFVFEEDGDGKRMIIKLNDFDFDFDEDTDIEEELEWVVEEDKDEKTTQKFRFIDDPNIEKLIMIDGKKADFKKLDELAKANKLQSVDFLKPDTAMSLYGKKAQDGAIIATTK